MMGATKPRKPILRTLSLLSFALTLVSSNHVEPETDDSKGAIQPKTGDASDSKRGTGQRIFCLILTMPKTRPAAVAVADTWAKRCDGYVFLSSEDDDAMKIVNTRTPEGRPNLWLKTVFGFQYAYEHAYKNFDWFLKADDDTYVVIDNLRAVLSNHSASEAIQFGCHFKKFVRQGYMSGGAGYVLSKEGLRRLNEDGFQKSVCAETHESEDVAMGECLEKVGVVPADSRDGKGRKRFMPFEPGTHLLPNNVKKVGGYQEYLKYPEESYFECCAEDSISFHYISQRNMYVLEYFIYYFKLNHDNSDV